MNAKFALALILTLQVTMSFCEAHDPPQELIDKVEAIKDRLYRRAEGTIARLLQHIGTFEQAQAVKGHLESLPDDPRVKATRQVLQAIRRELQPLTASIEHSLLGFYDTHIRQQARERVDAAIGQASEFLDQFAPIETN